MPKIYGYNHMMFRARVRIRDGNLSQTQKMFVLDGARMVKGGSTDYAAQSKYEAGV